MPALKVVCGKMAAVVLESDGNSSTMAGSPYCTGCTSLHPSVSSYLWEQKSASLNSPPLRGLFVWIVVVVAVVWCEVGWVSLHH